MKKGGIQPNEVYDESMCETARTLLSKGKSIARVATNLGVCRDTIYDWRDKHPEFARALRMGRDACQAHWEDMGENGTRGNLKGFVASSWIFTMKSRFKEDYSEEKQEQKTPDLSVLEGLLSGKITINK